SNIAMRISFLSPAAFQPSRFSVSKLKIDERNVFIQTPEYNNDQRKRRICGTACEPGPTQNDDLVLVVVLDEFNDQKHSDQEHHTVTCPRYSTVSPCDDSIQYVPCVAKASRAKEDACEREKVERDGDFEQRTSIRRPDRPCRPLGLRTLANQQFFNVAVNLDREKIQGHQQICALHD